MVAVDKGIQETAVAALQPNHRLLILGEIAAVAALHPIHRGRVIPVEGKVAAADAGTRMLQVILLWVAKIGKCFHDLQGDGVEP